MRNLRTKTAAFLGAASLLALAACGNSSDDNNSSSGAGGETIKIAAPVELSGPVAAAGKEWLQYLQFGVDQINAAGGIKSMGGRKLELLVKDTKSDPAAAPALVRAMHDQGAVFDVGPIASSGMVALKPTLISLEMPWIGVAADPSLTADDSKDTMFRITGSADQYAKGAFDFLKAQQAAGKIEIRKIGIASATAPPSPEYKAAIEKYAKANGWQTVSVDYDFTKTTDYSPIVAKLASQNVDLVMGQSYPPDAIGIAKAISLQSWRPKYGFLWLDGYQGYNDFRKAAGEDVTGWLDASNLAGKSQCDATNELSAKYAQKYGVPISSSSGGGPSVIAVIADALERARSTDPDKIKEALASSDIKYCEGMFGQLGGVKFDSHGNNTAFAPTIVQFTGTVDQTAVAPDAAKVADVTWPAN